MLTQKLKQEQLVFFINENLPYEVKAISDRYAIVSRKLHRREDADLLHHKVKMSAYLTFTDAFNANKENPVYSICDFKENIKAPDNLVFEIINYFNTEDCEKCIKMLELGEIELSHRNKVELNIDWNRTNILNDK
jgi:hypothetical protein